MAGLMKPRCWPACWSARAITPAHRGVAALVPEAGRRPTPLLSRAMAVAETAVAAPVGTPREARGAARPRSEGGGGGSLRWSAPEGFGRPIPALQLPQVG